MTVDVAPVIKGWCPGAHRPMMSGDGLVVRVRPFQAQLRADQVLGLCEITERFGNGMLDLTSRANLQIRGVAASAHEPLLAQLDALGLIDADPAVEGHRNILMPSTWQHGDLTHRLYQALLDRLSALPDLPEKMGFALDTGDVGGLCHGSADFRFELDDLGRLLLRADGAPGGRVIDEGDAMQALTEMAAWFVTTGGRAHGRMIRHLPHVPLPPEWQGVPPRPDAGPSVPGAVAGGTIVGAPFGKIAASDLRSLMTDSGATHVRLMLGRMMLLVGARVNTADGFALGPTRLMQVHACPGAPFCPQATVATLDLARALAPVTDGALHVSGCAKGCAYPRVARHTLVGRGGKFDLVSHGRPWDDPRQSGLDPSRLNDLKDLI